MFYCAQLSGDLCLHWVEYSGFLPLSIEDGLKIGGVFMLITATAYGCREIANLILNRR